MSHFIYSSLCRLARVWGIAGILAACTVAGAAPNLLWTATGIGTGKVVRVDTTGDAYVLSQDGYSARVTQYDTTGVQQWTYATTPVGSSGPGDTAADLCIDGSGNAYMLAQSQDTDGRPHYLTVMVSAAGVLQWSTRFANTPNSSYPVAIGVDSSGNVYDTGYATPATTNYDFLTLKYDSSGTLQWSRTWTASPGTTNSDYAKGIYVQPADGDVFVLGNSQYGIYPCCYSTVKYDTNGNLIWSDVANRNGGADYARAIVGDANAIYITGAASQGGIGQAVIWTIAYSATSSGATRLWTAAYNAPHDPRMPVVDNQGYALALDGLGNLYVAGASYAYYTTNWGCTLLKYNKSTGSLAWVRFHSLFGYTDTPVAIAANGNYVDTLIDSTNSSGALYSNFLSVTPANAVYGDLSWGGLPLSLALTSTGYVYTLTSGCQLRKYAMP